ncbi:MAG: helix-turn-helix domain-containing protein [Ignavibacteriaceae bacterium]|nr:helix-turn-helix domain-containing protein [Ignavibacteriaceae bacterium]
MEKTNIIQLYPLTEADNKAQMPEQKEILSGNSDTLKTSDLRLLSINKASKILGIRYETVVKLVKTGRIKSVMTLNNKHKVPYSSLVEFVNGSNEVKQVTAQVVPIEVTQNRIDNLLKEYAG